MVLYHYHHVVMIVDLLDLSIEYTWYECPTDKRGLDAAMNYIQEKKDKR